MPLCRLTCFCRCPAFPAPTQPTSSQELVDEYYDHLARPGTPLKTFRIRVFAFAATEAPIKPDDILDGQSVFRWAAWGLGDQHIAWVGIMSS